jgi:uncharacterized protein (DUF1499 family)
MGLEANTAVGAARWSGRIAIFSACLLLVTLVLHRFGLPTPLALNLFVAGLAGAGAALLLGLAASARIWFTGEPGAGAAAVGALLALAALAGPLAYATAYHDLPRISDVSTDVTEPPQFVELAKRPAGANPIAYPREFADLQAKAYPDLRTLELDRSVEEAFELVEEAVRRLRWRVIAEEPPTIGKEPGLIEATEQTLIVGFTDDIVIRIEGGASRSRIDARSASRFGSFDFGQNADRVRRFLAEVRSRAEITPSAATAARGRSDGGARALLKRRKARDQQKAESRNVRDPERPGARRAPARKETPRF